MSVSINVRDLPEHGLIIISPTDPSFRGKMSALLRGESGISLETIEPFSLFVKNTGDLTVVGYELKWDLTNPEGKTVTYRNSSINPGTLLGFVEPGSDDAKLGQVIKPHSTRYFSPLVALDLEGGNSGILGTVGNFPNSATANQAQQALRDKNQIAFFRALSSTLSEYSSLTVSIDWAIFEDGSFVGPDTSGFFAKFEAHRNAKYDLLYEIARDIKQGRPLDEVYNKVKVRADKPRPIMSPASTPTDYYNFFQKIYAEEVLSMRNAQGDSNAIAFALQPLKKERVKLRKR
jgi:hypothetical protein